MTSCYFKCHWPENRVEAKKIHGQAIAIKFMSLINSKIFEEMDCSIQVFKLKERQDKNRFAYIMQQKICLSLLAVVKLRQKQIRQQVTRQFEVTKYSQKQGKEKY